MLDSPLESQSGSLGLVYRPTEVLTLGFDGAYSRTSIPSELNQPNAAFPFIPVQATTGILTTRVNSTFYSFMPSIGYSFDALTRGKGTYSYGVFEGGGLTTTTQDVTLGLDHDVTPSLSISEAYDDNVFFTSSNRQDDFISRFMPGLKAGYQSEPFTLTGN